MRVCASMVKCDENENTYKAFRFLKDVQESPEKACELFSQNDECRPRLIDIYRLTA